MSEIQDAAQIIRVSFEGAEVAIKVGKAGWDFVKDICAVIKNVLDTEKLEGKTSVKKLLKMGGDLQVYKFKTEDLGTVKSLANKYGILYSILPDLNEADGMSEILFHSQAAPRIESIAKKLEGSRIESMDDYMSNAEPDKLGKMVDKMEKKPLVPDEKEYKLVVEELVKNPGTKVSDIRSRLNMTWLEIWPIIKHMEQNGLAKSKGGAVTMKMGADEFREFLDTAQWKALFGGKESDRRSGDRGQDKKIGEIRRIQKEYKDDPNINTVTIDRKMVLEETEKHIKTRIPYKKDEYIWLDKGEITWINENKTIFAGLKKDKKYVVLDSENKPVRTVSGQKLYEQSYDTVIRARMRQEQDNRRKKKQKNYRKTQQTLVEARNVLKGRNK
ncbi:PcfB family protein [Blautia sp.]|uniref:PcfB family protein n=1 Tax=Blautia sp. TaxID=1955243 RepID=UPI00258ED8ED|nr:PcfB family protein [Blautia sp.]